MSGDEWQKGLREECRVKMQGAEIKEGEGAEVAVLFPSTLAFRPPRHPTLDPRLVSVCGAASEIRIEAT